MRALRFFVEVFSACLAKVSNPFSWWRKALEHHSPFVKWWKLGVPGWLPFIDVLFTYRSVRMRITSRKTKKFFEEIFDIHRLVFNWFTRRRRRRRERAEQMWVSQSLMGMILLTQWALPIWPRRVCCALYLFRASEHLRTLLLCSFHFRIVRILLFDFISLEEFEQKKKRYACATMCSDERGLKKKRTSEREENKMFV